MTTNLVALLCVFRFFVGSSANNITNARHVVLESERGTAIILDLRVFIEAVKARILKGAKIISVLSPMGGAGSFSELEQIVRRNARADGDERDQQLEKAGRDDAGARVLE